MKQSIKGAILSGLVFPGLGQMVLGHVARGLGFAAVAVMCTVYLVAKTVDAVLQNLDALDPSDIERLANTIEVGAGPVVWILLACWMLALVDAYRLGDRKDRARASSG